MKTEEARAFALEILNSDFDDEAKFSEQSERLWALSAEDRSQVFWQVVWSIQLGRKNSKAKKSRKKAAQEKFVTDKSLVHQLRRSLKKQTGGVLRLSSKKTLEILTLNGLIPESPSRHERATGSGIHRKKVVLGTVYPIGNHGCERPTGVPNGN